MCGAERDLLFIIRQIEWWKREVIKNRTVNIGNPEF